MIARIRLSPDLPRKRPAPTRSTADLGKMAAPIRTVFEQKADFPKVIPRDVRTATLVVVRTIFFAPYTPGYSHRLYHQTFERNQARKPCHVVTASGLDRP